ncbi:hypothetical protein [Pseudoglutamicibacter albus]|uniref:hypothetical protein n=1 Tax=Pseudoglutamicibacter albus TaxID=98671 RepID=UPI00361A68FD
MGSLVQPAVILNGGKPGLEAIRDEFREVALAEGIAEPLFFETTEDDPGLGRLRRRWLRALI